MTQSLGWRLAFRNLIRNRRRTLSTGFGLTIAFVGISLLFGYLHNTDGSVGSLSVYIFRIGHIQIYKKDTPENKESVAPAFIFTAEESQKVLRLLQDESSEIEFAAGMLSMEALISNGTTSTPIYLNGFPPELDSLVDKNKLVRHWHPHIVSAREGSNLLDATRLEPNSISISRGVAELLDRARPLQEMKTKDKELSVAGRAADGDLNAVSAQIAAKHTTGMPYLEDVSVLAPLALVQDLMRMQGVSHFSLFLKDDDHLEKVQERLQKKFRQEGLEYEVLNFRNPRSGEYYDGTMSFLFSMGIFVGILILAASGMIVLNAITMSAMERLREMGTLRTLGYMPSQVRGLFVKEALIISLVSSVIGTALSELLCRLVNSMSIEYQAPGVTVGVPFLLASSPIFYLVLGLLLIGVSGLISFFVVHKKAKAEIPILLLESGASA